MMKYVDRILILFLALGIWALVLKPQEITAHSGQYCEIESGTGYGTGSGNGTGYEEDGYVEVEVEVDVEIYSLSGEVYCY